MASTQKLWNLRYVAGNPAKLTTVTTAAGGPMRRTEAVTEAKALAAHNPTWRIWVEHADNPGRRIFQSNAEARWVVTQEQKRIIAFAAKMDAEFPSRAPGPAAKPPLGGDDLKERLEQLSAPADPDHFTKAAKAFQPDGRVTLDALITSLEGMRDDWGGETPVFVENRSGYIHRPAIRADRASASGTAKLVSRQGVACIVIGVS